MAVESERHIVWRIAALAWPVLVGQWAVMAFSVFDTVMTGHASPEDLAAMALGSAIYGSVFVGLMGVVLALNPIIAQQFGAKDHARIGQTFVQGVWLALWLAIVGGIALGFPDTWLIMSDVSPVVRDHVSHYLHALVFALPAALFFRTAYALNTAISRPRVIMLINIAGLCMKIPLNYVFIYGKLGLPAMGAAGCGIATACVMWSCCAAALAILRFDPFYRSFAIRFAWPQWLRQKELLRIGIPMGMSYIVEATSFTFMALLVSRLGTFTTGGHQIAANLAGLCFMLPLSIAVATSTLTAQALGGQDPRLARHVVFTGLRTAMSVALVVTTLLWVCQRLIVALYSDDAAVRDVALSLIPFLMLFHLCDAIQGTAGFALRAYKRVVVPLIINTLALWGIGLGGGYVLAFHGVGRLAPLGAQGLWGAAGVSLLVSAIAQVVQLRRVANGTVSGTTPATQVAGSALGST